ncbi:hypothetical protein MsAg5_02180 [Methanosarcinaceae archaeon Ag5]|uniref:Uncharacterized protein n=1 Tax=Methanolapillus africanus TaxID=3028297 RepID=A0AAE4MGW0_9EURY|nr:hypothetical protein [Methanosarcinaceae archaeon Ag5]
MIKTENKSQQKENYGTIGKELHEKIMEWIDGLTEEDLKRMIQEQEHSNVSDTSMHDEYMRRKTLEKFGDFEQVTIDFPENIIGWLNELTEEEIDFFKSKYGNEYGFPIMTRSMYYEFMKWKESKTE